MVSAHAIRPPDDPLRSEALTRFGRRFVERALALSILLHLMAVGVYRASIRGDARHGEPENAGMPERVHTVDVWTPPPFTERSPGSATANRGTFDPVPEVLDPKRIIFGFPGEGRPVGPEGQPGILEPPPPPPPPDRARPFVGADTPPELVYAPKPSYPEWAREAGVEGRVLLRVLVGEDGRPKKVIVTGGVRALGEDAARAVMRWTFQPARSNGNPVEVWVEVPVLFQL